MHLLIRPHWFVFVPLLSVVLSLVACGNPPSAMNTENADTASSTQDQATYTEASLGTLEIHGYDFGGYQPATLNVERPGRYTVTFVNDGTIIHDIAFPDGTKIVAKPRETTSAEVNIPADGLNFISSLPTHAQAGMQGTITVGATAGTAEQPSVTHAQMAMPDTTMVRTHSDSNPPVQGDDTNATLGTLEIRGFDIGFEPARLNVAQPGRYTVKLVNDGQLLHDVTFPGGTKIVAKAGETASAGVDIPADGLNFICSVPGHAQAGMKGTITVGTTAATSEGGGNAGGDHGGPPPATSVQPDPNAPKYTLHDAAAPQALAGTVHDIELAIEEKEMTVAEGFVQKVWSFGPTVPGPVIRVRVGDTVRIHLKNPAANEVPHSIDFHSSQVAWNDEMTSINPGEEKVYEWKADYAGVWMYHCGTSPALHHIANGMYGMVIVEPKEGLPPVDKEFALVQSEWYLGPQKDLTSLEKAAAAAPAPDFVVLNGVANQYKDNPLQVVTGKRVRVFVLNAGPSVDSAFHVVGTIFDTVIKEGVQLIQGNPGNYGSQVVDLAPAQGAIVEFTTAEDGLYPIVTHAFNFVGRGALGLFQAGDGDPKN